MKSWYVFTIRFGDGTTEKISVFARSLDDSEDIIQELYYGIGTIVDIEHHFHLPEDCDSVYPGRTRMDRIISSGILNRRALLRQLGLMP